MGVEGLAASAAMGGVNGEEMKWVGVEKDVVVVVVGGEERLSSGWKRIEAECSIATTNECVEQLGWIRRAQYVSATAFHKLLLRPSVVEGQLERIVR